MVDQAVFGILSTRCVVGVLHPVLPKQLDECPDVQFRMIGGLVTALGEQEVFVYDRSHSPLLLLGIQVSFLTSS